MVKVRAAGLWEYPLGQIGLGKGTGEGGPDGLQAPVDGHAALDTTCRKVAPMLNITLPNVASPQQVGFVNQLTGGTGQAVRLRLRQHPSGDARFDLQHDREDPFHHEEQPGAALADQANDTVLDHITVMENTGLVNFDQALFTQTTPPKLPSDQLTPPAAQPGEPMIVLSPPPTSTTTPPTIRQ